MNKYTKIAIVFGVVLVAYMVFIKKSEAAPIPEPKPNPPVRHIPGSTRPNPNPKPVENQGT